MNEEKLPVSLVAEKLGVRGTQIYKWLEQQEEFGDEAFIGSGYLRKEDARLRKLQRENERLKLEIEILKLCASLREQTR